MPTRSITQQLKDHLAGESTTLATCWKIIRQDTQVFRFTDTDIGLDLSDGHYTPMGSGSVSALEYTADGSVDNISVSQILESDHIKAEDVDKGLFDGAKVEVYLVNYKDTSQGSITLFIGYLGEAKKRDDVDAEFELYSLSSKLKQIFGRKYTLQCDAFLGDDRCKVDASLYKYTGSVTSVTDNQNFKDSNLAAEIDYYKYGKVKWTSGNNSGTEMEVKSQDSNGNVTLFLPMIYDIQVGDDYDLEVGCDKKFFTCKDKFDNQLNFRGFPHLPGRDEVLKYPDANR